ncbi:hypothetical protein Taro_050214 [Colocasia esculenta]|uniref:Transcription factor Iwr1 domain-containing protein n=1 Tax=Colocasia esculenta TaxID=4460 RepID=A0A843XD53_COLES|nr:hypothetical protein [Colocasia esculenta]
MAEACEAASSSSSSYCHRPPSPSTLTPKEKPVVVRVKRKASQTRPDALWLEISERPPKKALLDLDKLSFSDSPNKEKDKDEKSSTRKVLVQHVETISSSEATKDFLDSCLILVRSARFKQIWKRRRAEGGRWDDLTHEMCHLYDVVRVDDEEVHKEMEEAEESIAEDNAILCNYLPLIREYLPTAADEIESDMVTTALSKDGYVYDIYTMENVPNANAEAVAQFPLVQVNDDDDCYVDQLDSDYETDDSNAENNPLNDYPDEETSEDEGDKGLLSDNTEEYEDEMVYTSEEEAQDWRWSYR